MTNLNAGANVPILMMGSDLQLRSWGPLSEKLFNLKASDLGRSIFDINLDLQTPDLKGRIEAVVAQEVDKEGGDGGTNGRWFVVRLGQYMTADKDIRDGDMDVYG